MSRENIASSHNGQTQSTTTTEGIEERLTDRTLSGGPLYVGLSMDADTYCIFADELEERANVIEEDGEDRAAEALRKVVETARLELMERVEQGTLQQTGSEQSIFAVTSEEVPAEPTGEKCDHCRYTATNRYLRAEGQKEAAEMVQESGFNGLCGDCVVQDLRESGVGPTNHSGESLALRKE